MKILGIAGWSGSGKTALITRLLPALRARGLRVSTIKHAHHHFDIDKPGKDSYQHRAAGAYEVLISSSKRWALMHEHIDEPEAGLDDLVARLAPVDLVLVEGFKAGNHEKIEVFRHKNGTSLLAESDAAVIAVASQDALPGFDRPVLPLDDAAAIADFIIKHCDLTAGERP